MALTRDTLKVGVAGVRGVVGQSFTPQLAASFAQAFGTYVGGGTVVVGRDTRPTGRMIEHAVVAGLQSVGCRPLVAGVVPTPSLLVLTESLGASGGIAITASHNPVEWNALKFVGRNGLFLNRAQADELFDIYHQQDFPLANEEQLRSVEGIASPTREHFTRVVEYVDVEAIRARGWKVAVDCCNGVGAVHTARFLEQKLGCDVVTLHDTPDGRFERPPEPLPEHLGALGEAVRANGCDIGFGQDPDGDRLAIVNEHGEPIGEDLTLAFAVHQVLAHHTPGPVVANLSASRSVADAAREFGSEVIRTRTGEIYVSETMVNIGAVVGGEHNGGVIVPAIHPCRDSYTAMALMLELMTVEDGTVSELRERIPRYALRKEKLPILPRQVPHLLRALRHHFADQDLILIDGVFVDGIDHWVHVRRSNTEPVLRLTVEAKTDEAADRRVAEVRGLIEAAIR